MSTEIIVVIITTVLSAFGAMIWKWVTRIESTLQDLSKSLTEISPTIEDHVLRLNENDKNTNQLIKKVIDIEEQMTHLMQIINREYYRISEIESSLSKLKTYQMKYRDMLKSQDEEVEDGKN